MARNKINDLRNHLFATIEGLLDEENPMDVNRATAVAKNAKVIVDMAKVEVQFYKELVGKDIRHTADGFFADIEVKKLEA